MKIVHYWNLALRVNLKFFKATNSLRFRKVVSCCVNENRPEKFKRISTKYKAEAVIII